MLDTLRASATGFFAKVLLGLLVLMFSAWGIGDILNSPSRKAAIATVGSETITSNDYQRALQREAENIRLIMGDSFSPEILKNPMISHHILQQLVNHALIKQESEALGLVPSDADVVRRIRSNAAFQNEKGAFDKNLFDNMLRSSHTSEKHYVDQLRLDIGANLLVETLTKNVPVPDIEVRTLLAARQEGRTISLYSLKPSSVTDIAVPTPEQVKTFYDAHSHDFMAPEYRTVSYVVLSADMVAKDAKIPEDDLRAAYKDRMDEFKHPERRVVDQLLYSSEDAAKKASAELKKGTSFEQVGKEPDVLNKGALALGKVEHGNIIEAAADKVFALQKGQMTDPTQSPFGWHIFRVTDILPPSTSSFEEMRPVLEKDLASHSGDEALNKLANKFQDAMAGGSTMSEAAHDLGLKVESVGPFDRMDIAPDGLKPAGALPDLNKFMEVAFKTEEGSESPMTASKGGVFYIVHVDKVTPERVRPLEEVKAQVSKAWQDNERHTKLQALASEASKKFAGASDHDALVEKYHLMLDKKVLISRTTQAVGEVALPQPLVSEIYSRKEQEGTAAYLGRNGDYVLAIVDSVVPAPTPESDAKMATTSLDIRKGLVTLGQNEILQEYTEALAKKYPVSINVSALQAVQN